MSETKELTSEEREKIYSLLNNVPSSDLPQDVIKVGEWDPRAELPFSGVPDYYAESKHYEYLGRYPSVCSKKIKNSIIGVGLETLDRDTFDPEKVIPLLGKAGVKYVRCQTGWIKTEKEKGVYDFEWIDKVVDNILDNGMIPWLSLSFGNPLYTPNEKFAEEWKKHTDKSDIPGWARGYVGEVPLYHGKEAMDAFLAYVRELVLHYKGKVYMYEVWNEPEGFWRKNGEHMVKTLGVEQATKDYAEFVRLVAEEVRKNEPKAFVNSVTAQSGTAYIQELGHTDIGNYIDAHSFHAYGSYTKNPESYFEQRVEHIKLNLSKPGKEIKIIQGESGRSSGKSMVKSAYSSEYNQAKFVARRYFTDAGSDLYVSSLFTASDFKKYYADGSNQYYGIIKGNGQPKLGYFTVAGIASLFDGLRIDKKNIALCFECDDVFEDSENTRAKICSFRKNGLPLFALWNPSYNDIHHEPKRCQLKIVTDGKNEINEPIVIDPVRRTVYRCECEKTPDAASCRMLIKPFYLLDYPLIVTDISVFKDFLE